METVSGGIVVVHAVAALFVLVLGPVQFIRRPKDRVHRYLGRAWLGAMVVTCVSSFGIMPGGFSWLHGLSLFTLASVSTGWVMARKKQWSTHAGCMIGAYVGTAIAFVFAAAVPTRTIQVTLASAPGLVVAIVGGVVTLAAGAFLAVRQVVERSAVQADD
ncbi:DUF2306 domain-containing protein [Zhihengliuella flava]|uniref:Membrane protein n=1 Tax=Zhihengliuella flava TaxID=1285193 RepID=A0A931GIW0_9MICC|nr:putative membrane protein [Zhihengliuella flava]